METQTENTLLPIEIPLSDADLPLAVRENLIKFSERAQGAYADNTLKAWRNDLKGYWRICGELGLQAFPASNKVIEQVISYMGDIVRKQKNNQKGEPIEVLAPRYRVATIRRYLTSISKLHTVAELYDPTRSSVADLALRRIKNQHGEDGFGQQVQATPLNLADLEAGIQKLSSTLRSDLIRALVSLAYDCLCRAEDLIRADVTDIREHSDGTGALRIRKGKTDQSGEGKVLFISRTTMGYLNHWIAALPLPSGALFRLVKDSQVSDTRIDYMFIYRAMKQVAQAAGLDDSQVSTHSCRVGAAQDMLGAGMTLAEIMNAGRWTSERMPARYTEYQQAGRSGMAKLCNRINR